MRTFGRKIAAGFAVAFALLLLVGIVGSGSVRMLAQTSRRVASTHQVLENVTKVLSQLRDAETGQRGFIITGDDTFLDSYRTGSGSVAQLVAELKTQTADNPAQQKRIADIQPLVSAKLEELARSIEMRRTSGFEPALTLVASGAGKRHMDDLRRVLAEMDAEERGLLAQRAASVAEAERAATRFIRFGTAVALAFVCVVAWLLARALKTQIATAVSQVQSSSAELQAAATQQATGSTQQATAMTEISTTINELLVTTQQISESAGRVAQFARQTAAAAQSGHTTVEGAFHSISGIRREIDRVVGAMVELGQKSQRIGAVLDIVSELAEQTNILAINATIEAAGAGEAGRRFSVVADEIRTLANRVARSTKEVAGLIDDVRAAVNTTVMATEAGSKSVDAGLRHFSDVTVSFKHITELVATTSEASREIELSTKQQMSAVEQVNVAIRAVSQTSRDTEASSTQTRQTASQLAGLSMNLLRLVQPQVSV